jgi:hypothetical protein
MTYHMTRRAISARPWLQTLLAELPSDPNDPFHRRVRVVVMNTKPGRHDVYERVRERFTAAAVTGEGLPADVAQRESRLVKTAAAHVVFVDHPG